MIERNGEKLGSVIADPSTSVPHLRHAKAEAEAEAAAVEELVETPVVPAADDDPDESDPAADAVEATPEPVVEAPKPAKPADKIVFGSALSKG